ncbi:MAG: cytochrome c [Acidobacteria bacterium]|nr:cytochrome c [Acidobacteriota bacterium]
MRAALRAMALAATALPVLGCGAPGPAVPADVSGVTPVAGESWVKRLGLAVEDTALGRMGGRAPAPPSQRREPDLATQPQQPFTLAGGDLYRLNCQSCHGPDGTGSLPEINSLIGPVQGTSAAWLVRQFNEKGRAVDEAFLKEVAASAEGDLRTRLRNGGQKMPPFDHLHADEVDALVGHLEKLAHVPDTDATDRLVSEPAARVGEHLVKGTCRVCHDATGPGVGRMRGRMMMRSNIPSLASLGAEASVGEVIAKVRDGSSRFMMPMMGPPRMPVFSYLTPAEISAALVYLAAFPPQPEAVARARRDRSSIP